MVAPKTPEFQRWFAGSKIVDERGEPRVLYHATAAPNDFSRFDMRRGDVGIHFGTKGQAQDRWDYVSSRDGRKPVEGEAPRMIPVHLSIKNPLRMSDAGFWNADNMTHQLLDKFPEDRSRIMRLTTSAQIRNYLESKGHDGIVYLNDGEVGGAKPLQDAQDVARKAMVDSQRRRGKPVNVYDKEDQETPEYAAFVEAQAAASRFRKENAEDSYIAFRPHQIKSAIGNRGTFDPNDPDITKATGGSVSDALRIARAAGGGFGADFGTISNYLGRPVGTGTAPSAPVVPPQKNYFAHLTANMPIPGSGGSEVDTGEYNPMGPERGATGDEARAGETRGSEWVNPLTGTPGYASIRDAWNNLGMGPGGLLNEASRIMSPTRLALEAAESVAKNAPMPWGGTLQDLGQNMFAAPGEGGYALPADVGRTQGFARAEQDVDYNHQFGNDVQQYDLGEFTPENHDAGNSGGATEQQDTSGGDWGSYSGSASDAMAEYQGSGQPEKRGGRVGRAGGGPVGRRLSPLGLYSAAAEAARNLKQPRGPGAQMLASLKGIKPDELKWSGADALRDRPLVTKEELADHFERNMPEVKETVLGERSDPNGDAYEAARSGRPRVKYSGDPKFATYQLPGGENYREVLLHLPSFGGVPKSFRSRREMGDWLRSKYGVANVDDYINKATPEEQKQFWALPGGLAADAAHTPPQDWAGDFRSSHWPVPNVLAHLRMSERDAGKTLHVEESQSDFGQAKRRGTAVPDAPYIGSTQGWTDLALKRALTEAAKGGYDRLVWTPGDEQAERYDLSKHISNIGWQKRGKLYNVSIFGKNGERVTQNQSADDQWLVDNVGKELADKMAKGEATRKHGDFNYLEGLDLKVGGEGMKGYYGTAEAPHAGIFGKRLLALAKEHDPEAGLGAHRISDPDGSSARVVFRPGAGYVAQDNGNDLGVFPTQHEAQAAVDKTGKAVPGHTLPALPITPKMRASILANGFKAYSSGGYVAPSRKVKVPSGADVSKALHLARAASAGR